MQRWQWRMLMVLMVLGLFASLLGSRTRNVQASPTDPFRWPYNQTTSISFNLADVTQAWTDWKNAQITATNAGGGGRLRVMGGVDGGSSVSEGMGYGILFASLFDDQATLDGLWLFTRDYLDAQGLMHWHIGNPGEIRGQGAASDGDEDMAIGLLNACIKVQKGSWPASPNGLNYCTLASNLINAIYQFEVDKAGSAPAGGLSNNPGGELLPGDQWNLGQDYPNGIVNLSYFAPGYFTVFGKFTNNQAGWNAVNTRNYQIVNLVQAKPGNCSKLVPNWNDYNGNSQLVSWQPSNYGWWSWDAARFAWRIAVDRSWYDTASARETTNEVGGFFSSIGMQNLRSQYQLNGASVDSYAGTFFVANAAAAVWAAPSPLAINCGAATGTLQSSPQQAYNGVLANKEVPNSYYGNAWRLLSLLLMTGNFPNLYELAQNNVATPTRTATTLPATATRTATPGGPTATQTATALVPTATRTATPGSSSLKVQYRNADSAAADNQIKPHLQIINTGASSVPLSELKLRYWFTNDGSAAPAYDCDYAVVGCANVRGTFATAARSGADRYLEVSFTAGTLAAGGSTGEIQNRIHKTDWSNYTETGDYSFDPTKPAFADWSKVTLYRNGTLVWGSEP